MTPIWPRPACFRHAVAPELLVVEHSHRPNTGAAQRYALFRSDMNAHEFVAAWSGSPGDNIDEKRVRRARHRIRKEPRQATQSLVKRLDWCDSALRHRYSRA
jgi:hypothetical protein